MLQTLLHKIEDLHVEFRGEMQTLTAAMRDGKKTPEETTDIGFLFRECESILDDWRKDCQASKLLAELLIAKVILFSPKSVNEGVEDTVHGTLATATPRLTTESGLPKRGTPEYTALLSHYGIPIELINKGLIALHYVEFAKEVTRLQEDGKPPPPGVGESYSKFRCTFRRKSNGRRPDKPVK